MILSNMDLSYLGIYSIWMNDLGESAQLPLLGLPRLTVARSQPKFSYIRWYDGPRAALLGASHRGLLQEAISAKV